MLKLIIVDDEKNTRESLKQYIQWSELGIDVVETAKNGHQALELAKQMRPDILLTDVRMPKMDGIELATNISKLYPECKIIFLSGFSDKEYLKAALNLKAVSYIEKPINEEEIKKIVGNAAALSQKETKIKAETEKLKNNLTESLPLIKQKLVLELIKEDSDFSKLYVKLQDIIENVSTESSYTILTMLINWQSNIEVNQRHSIQDDIMNILNQDSFTHTSSVLGGIDQAGNIVVAVITNNKESEENVHLIIKQYFDQILNISNGSFNITLGAGVMVNSISKVPVSYKTSVLASSKQFYHGTDRIFYYSYDMEKPRFEVDKTIYNDLKNYLKTDDIKSASSLIKKLAEDARSFSSLHISSIKCIYFNLLLVILEVARDRGMIDYYNESEKDYIWSEIDVSITLSQLSDNLLSKLKSTFGNMSDRNEKSRKANEIIKYIRERFSDKDLSIQSIANHAYLSQTYLCAYFKKTTGKTINEFITEVRIEKAKELLRDAHIKLYEITDTIGYTDVNYFSTIFKKHTGYTPSEFREKYYL